MARITRELLIEENKKRLKNLLSSNEEEEYITRVALDTYSNNINADLLKTIKREDIVSSSQYFINYNNIGYYNSLYKNSLLNFEDEKASILEGYKEELNFSLSKEKLLKKLIYENKKNRLAKENSFKRINSFIPSDLRRVSSLRNPDKIGFYFNLNDLCEVENNYIRLPKFSNFKVELNNIKVSIQDSSKFNSKDAVSKIKTEDTSCQFFFSEKKLQPEGVNLTLILELKSKNIFNEIEITDSSLYSTNITELYYIDSSKNKINIPYVKIIRNNKYLLLLEKTKAKRIYINFNQKNYYDFDQKRESVKNRIIKAGNSSFESEVDVNSYYLYEINIDKILIKNRQNKKTGVFQLKEIIDLNNKEYISIGLKGIYLEYLDINCFINKTIGRNENLHTELIKIENLNQKVDISNANHCEIMFILNEVEGSVYNSLIESIDIEVG